MVSFFGIKLGGEKKKKGENLPQGSGHPQLGNVDLSVLGDRQYFTSRFGAGSADAQVTTSVSGGPGVARTRTAKKSHSPYGAHGSQNQAAMSMTEFTKPFVSKRSSFSSLRQTSSNPNLKMGCNNGSSTSLAAPGGSYSSRPASPNGKSKTWVNPLDVQFGKAGPGSMPPKSPLGQHEFRASYLDYPDPEPPGPRVPRQDAPKQTTTTNPVKHPPSERLATPDKHMSAMPAPLQVLQIRESPSFDFPMLVPSGMSETPPSPPQSIQDPGSVARSSLDSLFSDARPQSRASKKNAPTGLREAQTATFHDSSEENDLPSPPASLPWDGDEHRPINEWDEPVIQNVRAKRDTLTVSAPRRRSLEKMIEQAGLKNSRAANQRPETPTTPEQLQPPRKSEKRRPPPLFQQPERPSGYVKQPLGSPWLKSPNSAPGSPPGLPNQSRNLTDPRPGTPNDPALHGKESPRLQRGFRVETPTGVEQRPLGRFQPATVDSRSETPSDADYRNPPRPIPPDSELQLQSSKVSGRSPMISRTAGAPAAAVGAHGRVGRPNTRGVPRPTLEEYGHPSGRNSDESTYRPESPIIPGGIIPRVRRQGTEDSASSGTSSQSQDSSSSLPQFTMVRQGTGDSGSSQGSSRYSPEPSFTRQPTITATQKSDERPQEIDATKVSRLGAPPTPDTPNWPLPSPVTSTFTAPRMPVVRSESPLLGPEESRSFSRPWTPTKASFNTPAGPGTGLGIRQAPVQGLEEPSRRGIVIMDGAGSNITPNSAGSRPLAGLRGSPISQSQGRRLEAAPHSHQNQNRYPYQEPRSPGIVDHDMEGGFI